MLRGTITTATTAAAAGKPAEEVDGRGCRWRGDAAAALRNLQTIFANKEQRRTKKEGVEL
jgi:hypothetical protein